MGASVLKVSAGVVALMIAAGRGPAGPKGAPGGNAMAVGLFTQLSGLKIPAGTDLVRTSGYSVVGRGSATYVSTTNTGATAWRVQTANGRWFELCEPKVSPRMLGAAGDYGSGNTDDTSALPPYFTYCLQQNVPGEIDADYRATGQIVVDYKYNPDNAPDLLGAGANCGSITFDLSIPLTGLTGGALYFTNSTQNDGSNGANAMFYPKVGGFSVYGNVPGGMLVQFGKEYFTDAFNGLQPGDMVIKNISTVDGSTSLEFNGCYATNCWGLITSNCGGASTWGTQDHGETFALRLRRSPFGFWNIACGNAYVLRHFADSYTFGGVMLTGDQEVGNEGIRSDSNTSNMTLLGGTGAQIEFPLNCAGSSDAAIHIHAPIYGDYSSFCKNSDVALGDTSWGGQGIYLHTPETSLIDPPSVPAEATWIQNRTLQAMRVFLSLPTGTDINIRLYYDFSSPGVQVANGANNQQMIILNPGEQIMWSGTYAPSWAWLPIY